jgi:integrase
VLTPAQVDAVAAAATNGLVGTTIIVAAYAGLRLGEVRALRWRDVDFAKRSIFVRRNYTGGVDQTPKSGKVRWVPMVDQALVALDRLSRRSHNTSPDSLVFCEEHGFYMQDYTIRNGFYDALKAAGLGALRTGADPIVFHDLRHTCGTLAVQAFPLTDVKAYMGHEDVSTTMIYVHHVPRHDAADKLSALLRRETSPIGSDGAVATGR